jgi:hypothetical protein
VRTVSVVRPPRQDADHRGEAGLGVDVVEMARRKEGEDDRGGRRVDVEPKNRQLRRPAAMCLSARSDWLFVIRRRPSSTDRRSACSCRIA